MQRRKSEPCLEATGRAGSDLLQDQENLDSVGEQEREGTEERGFKAEGTEDSMLKVLRGAVVTVTVCIAAQEMHTPCSFHGGRSTFHPLDFGLGYVTCSALWDLSGCDMSKGLKCACSEELPFLCFWYHHEKNMFWKACWPQNDERHVAQSNPRPVPCGAVPWPTRPGECYMLSGCVTELRNGWVE